MVSPTIIAQEVIEAIPVAEIYEGGRDWLRLYKKLFLYFLAGLFVLVKARSLVRPEELLSEIAFLADLLNVSPVSSGFSGHSLEENPLVRVPTSLPFLSGAALLKAYHYGQGAPVAFEEAVACVDSASLLLEDSRISVREFREIGTQTVTPNLLEEQKQEYLSRNERLE
jgi:hypothetical protein